MPVFNACEKPESFNKILIAVIVTLVIVFIEISKKELTVSVLVLVDEL